MALLWLESFDSLGTTNGVAPAPTNVMARKYTMTGESGIDIEAGFISGQCFENGTAGDRVFLTPVLTTCTTMIAGGWFCFTNGMAAQSEGAFQNLITFNEGANRSLALMQVGSGLVVTKGSASAAPQLMWTTKFKLPPDEWVFLELKAFCDNTVGWAQVRANGVAIMTVNNVDTQNSTQGYYDRCRFSCFEVGVKMDHLYVADTTGNSNNDYLGPIFVSPIRPDGDVDNGFDAGGYAEVDEAEDDTGTTNATTNSAGADLEMSYGATSNFAAIKGTMVCSTVSTDANVNLQHTSNDGATRVDTSNFSVNSTNINSYTTKCSVWETDPTGNAWTPSTVNSNAFGIEMQ